MTTTSAISVVQAHFLASIAAADRFFAAEAAHVAACCRAMAERFSAGGTLYVAGTGAQASDAQHVSVEFVHPIIVGKRALPAIALTSDSGLLTATGGADTAAAFVLPLTMLCRNQDMLLVLCADTLPFALREALQAARERGLLTILVSGRPKATAASDISFAIDEPNALLIQEVSETLYHVLWELVHVYLDAGDSQPASFLGPPPESTSDARLADQVMESTRQKARDVTALRRAVLEQYETDIRGAAAAMAARIKRGGRLLAFGNGGSATDAQDAAVDAVAPPVTGWRAIPAMTLTNDAGVVTAIANDVGVEHVFARQVAAFADSRDIALAFSTSGASRNILAGVAEAKSRGLLTVAMSGGDGGELARSKQVDVCITAPSEHLPRIQEAHATSWHALLAAAQEALL